MAKNNFFDKFWKPYLEYTADLGFGDEQTRQEILDLKIESGDYVANIGINWGTSIKFIFDVCPEEKKLIFDKIAATMGMHWLEETKSEAFLSMNRSLKLDGLITFLLLQLIIR